MSRIEFNVIIDNDETSVDDIASEEIEMAIHEMLHGLGIHGSDVTASEVG